MSSLNKPVTVRQTRFGIIVLCMIITGFLIVAALMWTSLRPVPGQNPTEVNQAARVENLKEITKLQNETWLKMGMNNPAKVEAAMMEAAAQLGGMTGQKSTYVVPGSPTQLAQMQAPAPVAPNGLPVSKTAGSAPEASPYPAGSSPAPAPSTNAPASAPPAPPADSPAPAPAPHVPAAESIPRVPGPATQAQ